MEFGNIADSWIRPLRTAVDRLRLIALGEALAPRASRSPSGASQRGFGAIYAALTGLSATNDSTLTAYTFTG